MNTKHTDSVEATIQAITELGIYTGDEVEPIFDVVTKVDDNGNTVDFEDYLRTKLTTLQATQSQQVEEAVRKVQERVKDALPMKQPEKCDDEDNCGLCGRGLQQKCHVQEISRVINEIRDDILQALTPNHQD